MTTGKPEPGATADDEFLAQLFPKATGHLAAQYASDYDTSAGLARFHARLAGHAESPAGADEVREHAEVPAAVPAEAGPGLVLPEDQAGEDYERQARALGPWVADDYEELPPWRQHYEEMP